MKPLTVVTPMKIIGICTLKSCRVFGNPGCRSLSLGLVGRWLLGPSSELTCPGNLSQLLVLPADGTGSCTPLPQCRQAAAAACATLLLTACAAAAGQAALLDADVVCSADKLGSIGGLAGALVLTPDGQCSLGDKVHCPVPMWGTCCSAHLLKHKNSKRQTHLHVRPAHSVPHIFAACMPPAPPLRAHACLVPAVTGEPRAVQ